MDVVRQLVGILLDHRIHPLAILLVDLHRQVHMDPILLEKTYFFIDHINRKLPAAFCDF